MRVCDTLSILMRFDCRACENGRVQAIKEDQRGVRGRCMIVHHGPRMVGSIHHRPRS